MAPTCDSSTETCRACQADAECSSSLCDAEMGACVAEATILYVSPTGTDTASCDQTDPCSIAHAFALVSASRDTIKLAPGAYTASLSIAGTNVIVYGFGATLTAGTTAGTFTIGNTSQVRLVGLTIEDPNPDTSEAAVRCTAGGGLTASLDLDQVTVESSSGVSIVIAACSLTMSRSHVINHSSAGISCEVVGTASIDRTLFEGGGGVAAPSRSSLVHITNSVFSNIVGVFGPFSGISLLSSGVGSMFVSFSTVIDSPVVCATGTPACAGGTAEGSCIDNSIVVNTQPGAPADAVSASCLASYTIVSPQSSALSGTNNQLGIDPLLKDPANRDYHLQSGSPAIDAADPAATDMVDFDGNPRPQGARSDLGAFEFKP